MRELLQQLQMSGEVPDQAPTGLTSDHYGDGCKCHGHCSNCWVTPAHPTEPQ